MRKSVKAKVGEGKDKPTLTLTKLYILQEFYCLVYTGVLLYGIYRGAVVRMSIFVLILAYELVQFLSPSELNKCTCDHF